MPAPFGAGEREPVAALDLEGDAVEERVAGELLAERGCDQDRHALRVEARYVCVVSSDARLQKLSIDTIRALAMDSVQKANAGHPGTAMALAPLAYTLYRNVMRHNPANPDWPNRDRFVLSAGHACILQYAVLHLSGYNLSLEELKRFRQWGSRTPGHPEHFLTEGIETTTGPLGQGFANGVGFAIADRFLAERYNRPQHDVVDRFVYAICSDGDMMEGVSMEAASIAGQLGLGRLVYFYDDNHITIDGTTSISYTTEDKGRRFEAHGWHVQSVDDAEDVGALERAIRAAQAEVERPSLIVVRSHIAFGAPQGDRHLQVARLAARRGRGPRDEGGARARPGRALRRAGRGLRAHGRPPLPGSRPSGSGSSASSAGPRPSPGCARTGTPIAPAGRDRAGSRPCRRSPRARTSPPATPARR